MGWPRIVKRICRQCQKARCRKAAHVYCSMACYRIGRRKVRPLCRICRQRPVSKQSRKGTCGRVCGGKARGPADRLQRRAALVIARQRGRAAFLKRMAAYLAREAAQLRDATTDLERAKVLARVYQKGKHDESAAAYYRHVVAARIRA